MRINEKAAALACRGLFAVPGTSVRGRLSSRSLTLFYMIFQQSTYQLSPAHLEILFRKILNVLRKALQPGIAQSSPIPAATSTDQPGKTARAPAAGSPPTHTRSGS